MNHNRWLALSAMVVITAACASGGGREASTGPSPGTGAGSAVAACAQGYREGQPGIGGIFCDGHARAHVTTGTATQDLTLGFCGPGIDKYSIGFGVAVNKDFTSDVTPDYLGVVLSADKRTVKIFVASVDGSARIGDRATVAASDGGKTLTVAGPDKYQPGSTITAVINC